MHINNHKFNLSCPLYQGELLAHAKHQDETILYAQITQQRTQEVRDIWPFLRDRRIESYECLSKRYCD